MTERSSAESNDPSLLNLEGEEFSLSFDTPELNLSFDIEELKGQRERRNVDENGQKGKGYLGSRFGGTEIQNQGKNREPEG